MGLVVLVTLQISLIFEMFQKAKSQHWPHFWFDVGAMYFLAFITGFIVTDAFNYHMRRRRERLARKDNDPPSP